MGTARRSSGRGKRRLPTFLVIGAMKAGTDSLYQYLRHHPQVFVSEVKELDYFTEELNWKRGTRWYQSHFAGAGSAIAVGEASTSYSKFPTYRRVPERIADLLPDVRIVYIIRQPVERMKSQFLHEVLMGEERAPIEKALLANTRYLDYSRYSLQISEYLKYFAREQLLVITSEALRSQRRDTLRRVFSFLGVNADWDDGALGFEYHITSEKRVPRGFMVPLQRLAAYRAVSRFVPETIKKVGRGATTRGIDPSRADISESLSKQVHMELRSDLERLRTFLGSDFDAWGLLDAPDSRVYP